MEPPTSGRGAGAAAAHGPPLRVLVPGVGWPLETFVERLLRGLADRGHRLTLLSGARPDPAWQAATGIGWRYGPFPLGPRSLAEQLRRHGVRSAATAVADRIRSGVGPDLSGIDVVYAPWLNVLIDHPDLLASPVPVVTSCRGSLVTVAPWHPHRPEFRPALARVLGAARLVHCVSDHLAAEAVALGLPAGRSRVVHPGVDPAAFAPGAARPVRPAGSPLRAVSVGTLIWVKDHEHALVAVRRAVDRGVDVTLDVIGDGPGRDAVRYAVDDLDLVDRVRLWGKRPPAEVARHLAEADVFLHASVTEGLSNAVLEAMAAGLAVITTDAGGMTEAVRPDVDGLVVPVRGAPATADALVRLAADADLRARLGASARERVATDFTLDRQIAGFEQVLHEAAAPEGHR